MGKRIDVLELIIYSCVLFAVIVGFNKALNIYALYIFIPASFIISFFIKDVLLKSRYLRILLLLYLWLFLCYPFAQNQVLANNEMKQILGTFILSYSIAAMSLNKKMVPLVYIIYIVLLVVAWFYAWNNIFSSIHMGKDRVNDDELNANTLAYYTLYATMSIYTLGDILSGKKQFVARLALWLMIIVSFVTAILTASRQVLIMQVPLLLVLIWIRYFRNHRRGFFTFCLFLALSIAAFEYFGKDIYENSLLQQRNSMAVKDDLRLEIAKECMEIGMQRPLLGYGPGNVVDLVSTHHGAHNSFLELFVNTGILGVLIFAYLILHYLSVQYKRWRKTKDEFFFVFFIFGLFWFVDQMFFVFYQNLWLMSFFILLGTHADVYYKSKYSCPFIK